MSVITLIEQMRQQFDFVFQKLLNRTINDELNENDVQLLNKRVVVRFLISNSLNNVIIVQFNQIKHLINRFQIEQSARFCNKSFFFSNEHFRVRKDDDNLI